MHGTSIFFNPAVSVDIKKCFPTYFIKRVMLILKRRTFHNFNTKIVIRLIPNIATPKL
jgi:hypothetical protein